MANRTAVAALALAALCVLLAVNEIFLHKPLMTPPLETPTEFAGHWTAGAINITIDSAGSVAGTVGAIEIQEARLERNRTWFGRRMKWRTDYIIRGTLKDGRPISAPVQPVADGFSGAMFLGPNFKGSGPTKMELRRTAG